MSTFQQYPSIVSVGVSELVSSYLTRFVSYGLEK
jgi:hypothetical protein